MHHTFHFAMAMTAACLLSVTNGSRLWAAPNTDEPLAAMATRADEESKALSAEATKQYQQAAAAITSIMQKLKAGDVKKISAKEFGASYTAMRRMQRLGKQLEQWGETAGIDFQVRSGGIGTDWTIAKREFIKLPEVASKLPQAYKTFSTDAKKREKNLAAAGQLFKQQKYVEAEKALLNDIEVLEGLSCLLDDSQMEPLANFYNALGKVMAELDKQRVQAGKDRLQGMIAADEPGFDALLAQMKQAATDLKAGENPKFDDVQMTGPEFVAAARDCEKPAPCGQ